MRDEDARLWELVEADGDCLPVVTLGEARAVVQLLLSLARRGGEGAMVADGLAARIARRLPTIGG